MPEGTRHRWEKHLAPSAFVDQRAFFKVQVLGSLHLIFKKILFKMSSRGISFHLTILILNQSKTLYQNNKSEAPGHLSYFSFCCPRQLSSPPKKRGRWPRSRSWDNSRGAGRKLLLSQFCSCLPNGLQDQDKSLQPSHCSPILAIPFIYSLLSSRHPLI